MKSHQLELLEQGGFAGIPAERQVGRIFYSSGRRMIDFCSTNYLGMDYEPSLIERGLEFAKQWGTVSNWSRLEVDPAPYPSLEARICRFLGAEEAILSHTITITNFSIMPRIVGKGVILADQKVHTVVWEACRLARDHGASLAKFAHQDLNDLERLLREHQHAPSRLIAVDGVYSLSTEIAPIREMQYLCSKYDAWLYIDDAHGLGILGADPTAENPYGTGGSGVVRHAGGDYSRTFYVSSFNKAFCTHTAFSTTPGLFQDRLRSSSTQYVFSAPVSPFTIGTVEAALDLNEQVGDARRAKLRDLTARFLAGVRRVGLTAENVGLHPVVFVKVGSFENLKTAAEFLTKAGIVAGLRAFPIVPPNECGLRFALSSLHEPAQVDECLQVLEDLTSILQGKRAA